MLLLAHPGHELLAYGLFAKHRVKVMVLTDGSGGSGQPRIAQTRALVTRLKGEMLEPSGCFTDSSFYNAILAQDVGFFRTFVDRVETWLASSLSESLICDAVEYYNPVHDLCSVIGRLAVKRRLHKGYAINTYACPIVTNSSIGIFYEHIIEGDVLSGKKRDISLVANLISDLDDIINKHCLRADIERIVLISPTSDLYPLPAEAPYYEEYGRRQIAKRGSGDLITYANHMRPLVDALERAEPSGCPSAKPHTDPA